MNSTQPRHTGTAAKARISGLLAGALIASGLTLPAASPAWAADLPDETAPVATITSPLADPITEVEVGGPLSAAFECIDPDSPVGYATSGLATTDGCVGEVFTAGAPEGATPLATAVPGADLDTTTAGSFELRVVATDSQGLVGTAVVPFTVLELAAAPADGTDPVVTINSPGEGVEVEVGAELLAAYSCADENGGSGIATCEGDVAEGQAVDTATVGAKTFTVTSTDVAGNSGSATVGYTVVAATPPPPASAQMTGTVRDTDGNLLPGSTVEARNAGEATIVASTTTNGDGVYSLTVPEGTYDLRVVGPGGSGLGGSDTDRVIPAGVTTINWSIGRPLATVLGRVLWDGVPDSYAMVAVSCPSSSASTTATTDGDFSVQVVAEPGCTLRLSTMNAGSISNIPLDTSTDTDLGTLDVPYSTVDVYVRNSANDPVPGVSVSLQGEVDPMTMMGSGFTSTIDLGNGLTATASQYSAWATTDSNGLAALKIIGTPTGNATITTNGNGTPTTTTTFPLTGTTTQVTIYTGSSGGLVPGTPGDLNDNDNVSPVVETQVPSRALDGNLVPGESGDGNGDGLPDAQQQNVTSVPVLGAEVGQQPYVTLASSAGTELTNVFTTDPADATKVATPPPAGVTLPEGLTNFILTNSGVGADQTISIYTQSTANVTGYAKYDPASGTWSLLPGDRVTIVNDYRVDIRLTDGGIGDADGEANGTIDDPGGLAFVEDTTPPVITVTGITDGAEYARGEVPVAGCSATDDLTGVNGGCVGEITGGEADGLGAFSYTATATDWAGNVAEVTVGYTVVNPDSTPPVVVGSPRTKPNANGWYREDVTIDWSATDPQPSSGGVNTPERSVITGEGVDLSATSDPSCDEAGNCATGTFGDVKIDRTPPTVTIHGGGETQPPLLPTYTLGDEPTLTCSAEDALSGLDGACSDEQTGGNANGVGLFTYTATATDMAGNTERASYVFRVVYGFAGFQQPINDPMSNPGTQRSVFKSGSNVPVKFALVDADGNPVTPLSAPLWVTPQRGTATSDQPNEADWTDPPTSGSEFQLTGSDWHYNWKSKGFEAGFTYRIGVRLDDGTTHYVVIALK